MLSGQAGGPRLRPLAAVRRSPGDVGVHVLAGVEVVGPEHGHQAAGLRMRLQPLVPVGHAVLRMPGHGGELGPGGAAVEGEAQEGAGLPRRGVVVILPVLVRLGEDTAGQGHDGVGAGRRGWVGFRLHRPGRAPGAPPVGGGGVHHPHGQQSLGPRVDEGQLGAGAVHEQGGGDELARGQLGEGQALVLAGTAVPVPAAVAVVAHLPGLAEVAAGEDAGMAVEGLALAAKAPGDVEGAVPGQVGRGEGAGPAVRRPFAPIVNVS